ncbi:MAG: tripartite tricarboxylate transporter TctB family protein [Desulfofustis sp. PB-SRB1]|nr:tripartite tricarboxylate transporter TctB family protein [Desulfofustis sp. PB-SRB1]
MKDERESAIRRDISISVVFILLGVLAIVNINSGEQGRVAETATLTASTLPTIYGALLIILAGIILLGALNKLLTGRQSKEPESINVVFDEIKATASPAVVLVRTFGALALLIIYALLLAYINFTILTACFLAALFVLLGRRSPLQIGLASVLGSIGFYILFIYFLNLPI